MINNKSWIVKFVTLVDYHSQLICDQSMYSRDTLKTNIKIIY